MKIKINEKWFIKVPSQEQIEEFKAVTTNEEDNNEEATILIDWHQTLLNIFYNWWQNNNDKSYSDFARYISKEYGFIFTGLLLAGKYNQQVGNGGHTQYYQNGYADGIGGYNRIHDFDHPLHQVLIIWMEEIEKIINSQQTFNTNYLEAFKSTKECILGFLKLPINTYEMVEDTEYDEDEDRYIDVEYENDEFGDLDRIESRKLDTKYFENSEIFMELLEFIATDLINQEKWITLE